SSTITVPCRMPRLRPQVLTAAMMSRRETGLNTGCCAREPIPGSRCLADSAQLSCAPAARAVDERWVMLFSRQNYPVRSEAFLLICESGAATFWVSNRECASARQPPELHGFGGFVLFAFPPFCSVSVGL